MAGAGKTVIECSQREPHAGLRYMACRKARVSPRPPRNISRGPARWWSRHQAGAGCVRTGPTKSAEASLNDRGRRYVYDESDPRALYVCPDNLGGGRVAAVVSKLPEAIVGCGRQRRRDRDGSRHDALARQPIIRAGAQSREFSSWCACKQHHAVPESSDAF